jgi:hypothetical protein
MIPRFTTIVGVDAEHLEELRLTWPTWRAHRPEILENPILFACDGRAVDRDEWEYLLRFVDHPQKLLYVTSSKGRSIVDNRHWMFNLLAGAVMNRKITTPYTMKLDTDTVACRGEWLQEEWFANYPHIVAPPWSYTKPAEMILDMERFCEGEVGQQFGADSARVRWTLWPDGRAACARVIGWCMFIHREWHQSVRCHVPILPIPSHDTFFWYFAQATGGRVNARQMPSWRHISTRNGRDRLRSACQQSLQEIA